MKITLDIDDELLSEAMAVSARECVSLDALVEEDLWLRLRRQDQQALLSRPALPIYRGQGGLAKDIDPTSNRSMRDATEAIVVEACQSVLK